MAGQTAVLREIELAPSAESDLAHFIVEDGLKFAGRHLLIDIWGATNLDNLSHVEATMRAAVEAAGATLLNLDLHYFTPNGGISGVAVLAESHMSIHTWPERGYAALDVFVCGTADPYKTVPVLKKAFNPEQVQLTDHRRGLEVHED